VIETERLLLRRWRNDDLAPFAALNADPAVMEHLPSLLDRAGTADLVRRIEEHFEAHGFGLWCVEVRDGPSCIGFVGLTRVRFETPFTPAVEVGWRLAHAAWGHGYASEGARAALDFAFDALRLREVVSFTVPANRRSRAVMERIGLAHDPDGDFDHPLLPEGHRLRRHVLYRITREAWRERASSRRGVVDGP
jgi:ribosomal-protein-alanine N-acetyltransferase